MSRNASYAVALSSLLIGIGSLILFASFLFPGSFGVIDMGLKPGQALVLDACLSLLFTGFIRSIRC